MPSAHVRKERKKTGRLDDGLIVRISTSGKRLVAFVWDRVDRVSMNITLSCIHSNPRVTGLAAGVEETRRGRIYFLEGGLDAFWKRYRADFRDAPRPAAK